MLPPCCKEGLWEPRGLLATCFTPEQVAVAGVLVIVVCGEFLNARDGLRYVPAAIRGILGRKGFFFDERVWTLKIR